MLIAWHSPPKNCSARTISPPICLPLLGTVIGGLFCEFFIT